MISDIREFVDGLYRLMPVSTDAQNRVVEHEIEALSISKDLGRLRLFESASAESYRIWSSRASAVIEASENGTIYRGVEDWISHAEAQRQHHQTLKPVQLVRDLPTVLPEDCKSTSLKL